MWKEIFYKKYVILKINVDEKKAIYISLYVIENIKKLEEKIYANFRRNFLLAFSRNDKKSYRKSDISNNIIKTIEDNVICYNKTNLVDEKLDMSDIMKLLGCSRHIFCFNKIFFEGV